MLNADESLALHMADEKVGRLLLIRGLVQGVGFRWHMTQVAQQHEVAGWVRNRRDGDVEALLCGRHEDVVAVMHWAQGGPPRARVDSVQVSECPQEEWPVDKNFSSAPTI